jgi:hypothetical protein
VTKENLSMSIATHPYMPSLPALSISRPDDVTSRAARQRETAVSAARAAAADNDDDIAFYVTRAHEAYDSRWRAYKAISKEDFRFFITAAAILCSAPVLILAAMLGWGAKWAEGVAVIGSATGMIGFICLLGSILVGDPFLVGRASVREELSKIAGGLWAVGDKAIYAVHEGSARSVFYDAMAKVTEQDGKLVITLRSGYPDYVLASTEAPGKSLHEVKVELMRRIAASRT